MNELIKSKISIADIILIALLTVVTIASAVHFFRRSDNCVVQIYKDNILIGEYPISENRDIKIDAHNSIRIEANKVRMSYADCPDKRCVKQGASDMFPIICLPNHVVVEIKTSGGKKQFLLY